MLLAKVQELQNSIPELEVKCDNLAEIEQQLREVIERLENEKTELITKQTELVTERDNLLTRCEEFTQTIYEYDVEKITMAGKMEEMQNKLEVKSVCNCVFYQPDTHFIDFKNAFYVEKNIAFGRIQWLRQ